MSVNTPGICNAISIRCLCTQRFNNKNFAYYCLSPLQSIDRLFRYANFNYISNNWREIIILITSFVPRVQSEMTTFRENVIY